jgi:pilus assembly protein Flp/PilA
MNMLKKLFQEESGQGMVEYGLIIALVAVVAIGGLTLLGPSIKNLFTNINTELQPKQ